jgi:hypothetical protein
MVASEMPCENVFAYKPGAADVAGCAGLVAAPAFGLVVFGVFVLDPVFFVVEFFVAVCCAAESGHFDC